MKNNRVPFLIFLFVSIFFTFTFIKPSETHHLVTCNAEFSKHTFLFWTYYKAGGGVTAPLLTTNNQISVGWFRIKGYINYKGINIGWDYRANARNKGFKWADSTTKTVWGSGDDDDIVGYAETSLINQEDYAWDYDNEL